MELHSAALRRRSDPGRLVSGEHGTNTALPLTHVAWQLRDSANCDRAGQRAYIKSQYLPGARPHCQQCGHKQQHARQSRPRSVCAPARHTAHVSRAAARRRSSPLGPSSPWLPIHAQGCEWLPIHAQGFGTLHARGFGLQWLFATRRGRWTTGCSKYSQPG